MDNSQIARGGRPRALGGQSRCDAVAPTSRQSPPVPWRPVICDGSCRRNHDHPLKCRGSSRRPSWMLRTVFLRLSTSQILFWNFSVLFDEPTGHRRNAGIRAGGHLGGHLGFALRIPWETARRPQDRSSAFLQGILSKSACVDCKYAAILAVAFHPVKMQAIWPAALDGAPSGHRRTTSRPQNTFSK